jgi:2-polyprenyl-3-methyl-5-hydroxy-6-metoxy-1,4-benzoquinol methylase
MSACHLCGESGLLPLINFGEHPIAHHFLADPSQEEYVHPVNLCLCESCGLAQLANPVPAEMLYTEYNWLSSWKLQPHVPRLVQLLEQLPGLEKTSKIVEVGCNDGSFLAVLRERGYRNLLGVEPAQDAWEASRQKGIETVGAYFTRATAHDIVSAHGRCDLFVTRQVLEHITELADFRDAMRNLLAPGGFVLIEVPNFAFSLAAPDYSAIWEEHVNHFTLDTVRLFLADAGVRVVHSETANFCGEALIVVGEYVGHQPLPRLPGYLDDLRAKALAYQDLWPIFRDALVWYLREQQKSGAKIALYGAGGRACCLINFAGLGPYLEFIVDDQPEKQGKYMPGSRLPILPGETLEKHPIALCLLAVNAESEEKVIAKHQEYLEKGGRFASVLPPSERLLPVWSDIGA